MRFIVVIIALTVFPLAIVACAPSGGSDGPPDTCATEGDIGCACTADALCAGDFTCVDGACAAGDPNGDGDTLTTCNMGGFVGDGDGDGDGGCEQNINSVPGPFAVHTCDDTVPLAYAHTVAGDVVITLGDADIGEFNFPRCVRKIGSPGDDGRLLVKDSPQLRLFRTDPHLEVLGDVDVEMVRRGVGTGAQIHARIITNTLRFTGSEIFGLTESVGTGLVVADASEVYFPRLTAASTIAIASAHVETMYFGALVSVGALQLELSTSPIDSVMLSALMEATSITIDGESLLAIGLQALERFDTLTIKTGPSMLDFSLPALVEGGHVHIEGTGACTSTLEAMFDAAVTEGRLDAFTLVNNDDC